ncbi:MAG: glycosyltransferase family 4 protein [Burkholderiales bacterium]|nr:glycosyltransferase family 4 protein [Anaerolineae bacterium]
MRVLHVIDSLAVGGAERMLVEIANGTAADGHAVFACVTRADTTLAAELRPEIALNVLNRQRRFDLADMRRFADYTRQQRIDLMHVHGRTTLSFVLAGRALRLTRSPIVFHDHNGGIGFDAPAPLWFRCWGRRHIAQYVGVSAKLGAWAASSGIIPERIHVIDNALDLSRFSVGATHVSPALSLRAELAIPDEMLLGVVVGGIRRDKGVDVLLDAVAQSQQRVTFKIALIGGERDADYVAACREQCAALGLSDTVIFAGERSDIAALLPQADFAVLPSRSESGPLVLIEFMAAGLPFVAARVGSVGERVSALNLAEFVPPEDALGLAQALDNLLRLTPQQRRERGQIGQAVARRYFDIRQTMPQWYDVYNAAITDKGL